MKALITDIRFIQIATITKFFTGIIILVIIIIPATTFFFVITFFFCVYIITFILMKHDVSDKTCLVFYSKAINAIILILAKA